jgi:hypothetical protein
MRALYEIESDIVTVSDPFGGVDEDLSNQPINDPDD